MRVSVNKRFLARILPLAAILVVAPVALSGDAGVTTNEACGTELEPVAAGTCCLSKTAICNAGAGDHKGYYYKSSGPC
ncbi:MAG TPA: hypothetical protein VGR37_02085 [Longimicrobiaceae bacterium]|nr:hypothetical protein [Longimicrobiaceae bacterium]